MKLILGINIIITSGNGDRENMEPIRRTSRSPTKAATNDQFSHFKTLDSVLENQKGQDGVEG